MALELSVERVKASFLPWALGNLICVSNTPEGALITLYFAWLTATIQQMSAPFLSPGPTYHTDLYKPQETVPPKGLAQSLALTVDLLSITLSDCTTGNRETSETLGSSSHFLTNLPPQLQVNVLNPEHWLQNPGPVVRLPPPWAATVGHPRT